MPVHCCSGLVVGAVEDITDFTANLDGMSVFATFAAQPTWLVGRIMIVALAAWRMRSSIGPLGGLCSSR